MCIYCASINLFQYFIGISLFAETAQIDTEILTNAAAKNLSIVRCRVKASRRTFQQYPDFGRCYGHDDPETQI